MSVYHLRGAVPLSSPAYVDRAFERAVLEHIFADRWVLLLGPRQHGKSAGLIRIRHELINAGYQCAKVDLQAAPLCESYDDFLAWLASEIAHDLHTTVQTSSPRFDSRNVNRWLSNAIPSGDVPVVVILDEASAIGETRWLENFYGQLRSINNRRAEAQADEIAHRLLFTFAGTFLPEDLIHDGQNSPFNVCEKVYTDDLDVEKICRLQNQVEGFTQETLINHLYGLVGGQPYLAQVILEGLRQVEPAKRLENLAAVADVCLSNNDDHFASIFRKVETKPSLISIVTKMLEEGSVDISPGESDYRYLHIIGLATIAGTKLSFRNAVYKEVAGRRLLAEASRSSVHGVKGGMTLDSGLNQPNVISILFVSSDPSDASRLRLDQEHRDIQENLRQAPNRDRFRLAVQPAARTTDISRALLEVRPQIVHFSGHGTDTGGLCFENNLGEAQIVRPEALAALFKLFSEHVSCVVLNACYSEAQARAIAEHIEYVIGMNSAIDDKAAIAFSVGFYQALGAGRNTEDAYNLGCVQIGLQGIPECDTPVLHKRGRDT